MRYMILMTVMLVGTSCFVSGDKPTKKIKQEIENAQGKGKKELRKEADPQASPKEALNNDFSKMSYLWLLSLAFGIGCAGFGVFLEKSAGSGESLIGTGLTLMGIGIGGPVAIFILKVTTMIFYWAALAAAIAASAFGIYKLCMFVKKQEKRKRQLVKGTAKLIKEPGDKVLLKAEQDEDTRDDVDRIRKEVGLK